MRSAKVFDLTQADQDNSEDGNSSSPQRELGARNPAGFGPCHPGDDRNDVTENGQDAYIIAPTPRQGAPTTPLDDLIGRQQALPPPWISDLLDSIDILEKQVRELQNAQPRSPTPSRGRSPRGQSPRSPRSPHFAAGPEPVYEDVQHTAVAQQGPEIGDRHSFTRLAGMCKESPYRT